MRPADQFRAAILAALGHAPAEVIADGKLHRFATSDKRGDDSGWYIFHDDGIPAGSFGDWRTSANETWRADTGRALTREEETAHRARVAAMRKAREEEEARRHAEARAKAAKIWDGAKQGNCGRGACPVHPYLFRKGANSHGIRQHGSAILVPMRDADGTLHSLQRITEEGAKRFMTGGRVKGCFHLFGGDPDTAGVLCVAEGYATGASVYEATGFPVAVAFDAGNLAPVAEALRGKYPTARLIFAADDDAGTDSNPGLTKATEAARTCGGLVAIPNFGTDRPLKATDFNDLAAHLGAETVKAQIEAANAPAPSPSPTLENAATGQIESLSAEETPTPVLLDSPPLSILPRGALPGWFGDMAESVSEATETPLELAALLGLATLAACCQKTFHVNPEHDYFEPLNLWAVVALPSGNRKSAVLRSMTRPVLDWERERSEALGPVIKEAESKKKTLEARINHLRKKAAESTEHGKARQSEKELRSAEDAIPEIPHAPQRWTQDVTPEKLGALMAENDERMALLSDEGGIFDTLGGRYSSGIPNLDLFLQAHAGNFVRVDRGSRQSVFMEHPALTLGLSPQPDVLRGLAEKPGFRGRGLLARFLFALPSSTLGRRHLNPIPVSPVVAEAYRRGLFALLEYSSATGKDGRPAPHIIGFSRGAHGEWKDYQRFLEVELREGGKFEFATDWASKSPGQAARVAGLLHCVESQRPDQEQISRETMTRALDLMAMLCEHALAAFSLMGTDPNIEAAKKVWRWVERERRDTFTARDAFNALRGSLPKRKDIDPAFEILRERYYITALDDDRPGPGRRSEIFKVNPKAAELWR